MNRRTRSAVTRWLARAVVPGALALAMTAPVAAAQAQHIRIEIDETFQDPFLSDACGTPVFVTNQASVLVTLVFNRSGLLVQEISPAGGGVATVSAPETGNAVSWSFNTTHVDYGAGAETGSAFTMRITGLAGHVPGHIESDAGQLLVAGVVAGFDEEDLPILVFTDLIWVRGNAENPGDVVDAMCAALNP